MASWTLYTGPGRWGTPGHTALLYLACQDGRVYKGADVYNCLNGMGAKDIGYPHNSNQGGTHKTGYQEASRPLGGLS